MHSTIIIVIAVCAFAVAIAMSLVPNEITFDHMLRKYQASDDNRERYEQEVASGDYRHLLPLLDIYLANEEYDRGITLAREMLAENKTDIELLRSLYYFQQGKGYKGRMIITLEQLTHLTLDEEFLIPLSNLYNENNDYKNQLRILSYLTMIKPDAAQHYIEIAEINRLMGDEENYARVINSMADREDLKFEFQSLLSFVYALVKEGEYAKALQYSTDWINQNTVPKEIAELGNVYRNAGRPDLSIQLIEPFYEEHKGNPDFLFEYLHTQVELGDSQMAYAKLLEYEKTHPLSEELQKLLLVLSMQHANQETFLAIIEKTNLQQLDEPVLLSLISYAVDKDFEVLKNILLSALDIPATESRRVLSTSLDFIRPKETFDAKDTGAKIRSLENPQSHQAIHLADLCRRRGMMLCSADMLKKLQPYENVSHYEIGALSTLLINLGQEKIAYELLSELKRDEKNRVILNSWLRAASANNKRTEIEEFTNGPSFYLITERTIKDSFYIASNHKFDALALFFTEMLVHNNPSQENRSLHALALTHNKQYDRAAKLIIALKDEGVDVGQHYEYILFQAAKRSATYRDYYVNHLVSQLNAPDLTPEKEERTVHDVVAFGGEELVLERIKLAAHSKGGMWAELYVTALRKLGMDEKINAFEKKRNKEILKEEVPKQVAKKPVKKPSKLEQAKALIAKGKITQAENILLALGKNKSPRNHANELLLYLWGLRPTDTRLNKISEIVSSSSIHRKAWLQALYYAGGYRQFVDFVKENPSWLKHETFYEFYLQSHLHLGETERVRQLMEENIRATKSAKRLMWNGDKALQYGMYDLAREAYLKAVELMPDNVDVKLAERLTRAFFLVEDFEKTLHYGELYKEMEGPSPVPYYYVGDTLWRQFKPDEAREYFSDTLARIKKSGGAKTRDIRLIRAASLVRLEQYEQARQAVAELIEEDPLDTFLQADYLQILLEMKDYDAADAYSRTVVLETLKEVELPKAAALTLRRVQNPSEVVISSPKDEALLESTIALLKKNAVWLESSHSGFQHMVLKTAQDHAFYWKKHRNSSTITLGVKPHLFDDASVKKRKDLEVRIALLKARLKTEQGMRYDARKILKEIDSKYPDDPHILSALAYNHFAFKRFMNAFKDMDKALQQLPENDQIQDGRFEIRRFVPPYVLADIEWQKLGNDSQVRLLLEGKIVNRHNLGAVARKRMNFYDAKGIRKSDGRFGDFSGTAFDFTLGVFKEHKEGQLWSAEIYNNGEFTGFGGEFSMINRSGAATARVEYHKAVWDFVEGVSDNAVRDRFQLSQHFTRSPLIQSDVAVSINEYHVESANSVAESIALESHIRVPAIYIDEDWYEPLSFGYGLDAEYRTSIERAIDSTGVEYSLYPLVSREVHFFDIAYRDEIDENSLLEGYVGYAFDRLGDSGASTGFKWTHDITDHLQGQIRAGYGVSLTQTSVGLGTFGGYLKYHF